jgi:hypothetical protein
MTDLPPPSVLIICYGSAMGLLAITCLLLRILT